MIQYLVNVADVIVVIVLACALVDDYIESFHGQNTDNPHTNDHPSTK